MLREYLVSFDKNVKIFDGNARDYWPWRTTLRLFLSTIGYAPLIQATATPAALAKLKTTHCDINAQLYHAILLRLTGPANAKIIGVTHEDGRGVLDALDEAYPIYSAEDREDTLETMNQLSLDDDDVCKFATGLEAILSLLLEQGALPDEMAHHRRSAKRVFLRKIMPQQQHQVLYYYIINQNFDWPGIVKHLNHPSFRRMHQGGPPAGQTAFAAAATSSSGPAHQSQYGQHHTPSHQPGDVHSRLSHPHRGGRGGERYGSRPYLYGGTSDRGRGRGWSNSNRGRAAAFNNRGGRGGFNGSGSGSGSSRQKGNNGRCYFCNSEDHSQPNCPHYRQAMESFHSNQMTVLYTETDADQAAYMLQDIKLYSTTSGQPRTQESHHELVLDTGASSHVISDRALFSFLKQQATTINVAGGSTVIALGTGTALVSVPDSTGTPTPLLLPNTLYLPDGPNLLSTSGFPAAGHSISIGGRNPHIRLASGAILPLHQSGGLFKLRLHMQVRAATMPATLCAATSSADTTTTTNNTPCAPSAKALLNHRALGHLNEADMRRTQQLQAHESLPFCEACQLGKSKRKHVPRAAAPRDLAPGQLTHSDINGPMEIPSHTGRRYAINFIDDATRYTTIYLVKNKSDLPGCFETYVNWLYSHGITVGPGCILQSDNDTVYTNQAFVKQCAQRGIQQQFSAPYT
jgi:hypothetical protein